ncbi:hypothetical protein HPB48_025582 [Haemaphysalis longicornis]|uniref:LisH domain-containing protein ARMC9 n=1 Tax=Haemaphysalis longicornis TaxID=44386 RepID=A0A9J6H961_HAELO|nr:hypothetical protein HPB48_025582 [Haemaphysalis longicornis]
MVLQNTLQYLDYMGLQNVSKLFEEECLLHNKPIQENFATYRSERMQKIQKELLCYFEEGRQAEFFAVWDSLIMRSRPAATVAPCGDLEFYLRLHFAIYPQRYPEKAKCQGNLTAEGAMANFRQYIESIKAHTEDPLVYFALPYVQNPRQFPVFKSIFEESWVEDLKSKVEKFVQDCLSTQYHQCSKPRLVDLYYCNDVELNDVRQDFRCCEQRLQETERHRAMQEKQVSKLQEDYKTLVTVTAELLTALEATIRGDLVNLENVLASCGQRFPELVKLQTPQTSQASSLDDPQAFVLRSGLCTKRARLDFNKIKQDLSEVDASTRALLLQALRWKLTKASSVEERDCVLLAYVENDLLGFIERSPDYCNRILHLIKSPNSGLQQSFVRFLNAFAAFRSGRSYLARNLQLVAVLTDSLVSNHVINSRTGDMILGTLQKLSLRQQQKEIMINHGILEWIVRTLQESGEDEISDYGIEYITALFMNLCLQKSGKFCCWEVLAALHESQEESEPEPELEMDDIVQALPHQMYGDQLLKMFYQEENQDTASQRGLTASRVHSSSRRRTGIRTGEADNRGGKDTRGGCCCNHSTKWRKSEWIEHAGVQHSVQLEAQDSSHPRAEQLWHFEQQGGLHTDQLTIIAQESRQHRLQGQRLRWPSTPQHRTRPSSKVKSGTRCPAAAAVLRPAVFCCSGYFIILLRTGSAEEAASRCRLGYVVVVAGGKEGRCLSCACSSWPVR